jgi:DNA-directed RNA polymerase specialized sigma24 family protein
MSTDRDDLGAAVDRAASAVARRYGSVTTVDDMRQSGWEWVLSHPARLEHHRLPDGTLFRNNLTSDLIRHLTELAKQERAAAQGVPWDDQYAYNAGVVDLVLPAVWDARYRPPAVEARTRSVADPAVAGNWEAMVADVRRAVDALPLSQRRVLFAYYGHARGGGWREAAATLGMSKTAANDIGREAIASVVDTLNGIPDDVEPKYVGTRRVESNASAMARTANDWGGE